MAKLKFKKAIPQVFPLTSTAGRVALLVGLTAGTVSRPEVEAAVLQDIEPRRYRKPVVAWGIRFESITLAAEARAEIGYKAFMGPVEYMRRVKQWQKNIANWCNADNLQGFYWAE